MPAWSIDEVDALREIAEVENALFDGYPIDPYQGSHQKGCIRIAAERLRINDQALRRRVGSRNSPGAITIRYGFQVDWSMYRAPPEPPPVLLPPKDDSPAQSADAVEWRRLKDEVARLRAAEQILLRRVADAEDIRAGVLGLTEQPLIPRVILPSRDGISGGRTVILHLSDVHYGEVVRLDEMDGLNRYDAAVARARLDRFFARATELMTRHWKGEPPDEIVLCLGGDLISGNIHPELERTNLPAVPATVKEVGEHIAGGIVLMRKSVKRPIRVMSVPGNHGRMTMKPQSKGRSAGSLDLLATDFCEAVVRGARVDDVTFYKATSPDLYFSTYSWSWCLTHGDAMGGRGGGTGFIGPLANITKGHRKLVDTSWRSGRPVHFVLTAHYHTTCKTTFGWGNGAVVGYGEYARDLRADPEVARQNMLIVHPHHGVIVDQPIYLGVPDEGSLYAGPASIVRPQWGEA